MMVNRVCAHIYVDNLKSIRLAERLGFTFQGETEMCLFHNQQYLHKTYTLDCSSLK
jgi:RimJ/RimL family protein N-acetyltransferase